MSKQQILRFVALTEVNPQCRNLQFQIRLCAEFALFIGAILYIVAALRESRFLGYKMFVENLVNFALKPSIKDFHYLFIHSDDSSVSCHVSILVLYYDGGALVAVFLFNRNRRSCCCRHYANNSSVFPLLLPVS